MTEDRSENEKLLHAHAELQLGIRQCQELVADLRSKLAANGNEPVSDNDREAEAEDQSAS